MDSFQKLISQLAYRELDADNINFVGVSVDTSAINEIEIGVNVLSKQMDVAKAKCLILKVVQHCRLIGFFVEIVAFDVQYGDKVAYLSYIPEDDQFYFEKHSKMPEVCL